MWPLIWLLVLFSHLLRAHRHCETLQAVFDKVALDKKSEVSAFKIVCEQRKRTVVASRDIKKGEQYAVVPDKFILWTGDLPTPLTAQNIKDLERTKFQLLAAGLLFEKQSNSSRFKTFIDHLPDQKHHPFFWSPDQLEGLRGTYAAHYLKTRKAEAQTDMESILPEKKSEHRLLLWAYTTVISRSIGIVGTPHTALVPALDSLNHNVPYNSICFMEHIGHPSGKGRWVTKSHACTIT